MSLKSAAFSLAVFITTVAHGQAWKDAYDHALSAIKDQNWAAAQTAFKESIAVRPEDQSSPTVLPGPPTEPIKWRSGSPYSPNFGVAYCDYKMGLKAEGAEKKQYLTAAASGFETLLAKNQVSAPAFYFLNETYGLLEMPDKQREIGEKLKGGIEWKVDASLLTPEENAQIASLAGANVVTAPGIASGGTGVGPKVTVVDTGNRISTPLTSLAGIVPTLANKFALIIGNSETQMSSGSIPFAASDAMVVRDALVQNAGYADKNVDVVVNATADQIRVSAKALADRMPQDGILLIYFSGVGVNVDGKDYIAGVDAAMSTDTSKMVAEEQIISMFRNTGAQIFAFHQANRVVTDGRYFGMERPISGNYALCQATSPGELVYGGMTGGKMVGSYTKAFIDVLATYRSNRIPISEFSWAVFNSMQGGGNGTSGSSTKQTPCLPVMQHLKQDAWF